jgi:hypothetical protein
MRHIFVIPWGSSAYEAEQLLHVLDHVVVAAPTKKYELIAPPSLKEFTPAHCRFSALPQWVQWLPFGWGWSLYYRVIGKGTKKITSASSVAKKRVQQNLSPLLAACYATVPQAEPALYFFVWCQPGNTAALLFLLKAFSLFKKRQQSSMQLVIPASILASLPAGSIDWDNYKFRSSIVWAPIHSIATVYQVEAKAYACIGMDEQGNASWWLQKTAQLQVPLLLSDRVPLDHETPKEALLFFSSTILQDLADKMMEIYKDENLRSQLVKAARATQGDSLPITATTLEQLL